MGQVKFAVELTWDDRTEHECRRCTGTRLTLDVVSVQMELVRAIGLHDDLHNTPELDINGLFSTDHAVMSNRDPDNQTRMGSLRSRKESNVDAGGASPGGL